MKVYADKATMEAAAMATIISINVKPDFDDNRRASPAEQDRIAWQPERRQVRQTATAIPPFLAARSDQQTT